VKNPLYLIEQQEKKLQLQRQALKKKSSINQLEHRRTVTALSPDRRPQMAFSPGRTFNNAYSPFKTPAFSTKIDEPIKKVDEKFATREPMKIYSTKVIDLAEISKMNNLKINVNNMDTNNKTNNLKKAPENNFTPKSKNEIKTEIIFSKKKTLNDIAIPQPRDVNYLKKSILEFCGAKGSDYN
jgi:hypothetical protein